MIVYPDSTRMEWKRLRSMSEEVYMAVYTVLDRKAVKRLVKDYGLGRLSTVQGISAGSVNTHYCLESTKGKFILRIDEVKDTSDAQREIDFLLFLRKQGFPCPRPVADKSGSYLQDYEKKAVSIYRHLAGKDFSAATLTNDHIEKIGQTLARLHIIGQEYDTPIRNRFAFDRVRSIYQNLRGRITVHLKHISHVLDDEIAHQEEYREEKLPKGMIHGDLFPDNVLFRGGRVVGVLDFEAACFGKFIADLATAVNAMCYHEERYHIGRFNALLDGYQSERTLSLAEWDAFPNELRFSAFRFTLTRLRDFFFRHMDEKRRVNKDYREFFHRLRILRRERSGGMDQMLLTMATGYDYRKYQKIHAEEKGVNA